MLWRLTTSSFSTCSTSRRACSSLIFSCPAGAHIVSVSQACDPQSSFRQRILGSCYELPTDFALALVLHCVNLPPGCMLPGKLHQDAHRPYPLALAIPLLRLPIALGVCLLNAPGDDAQGR